MSIIADIREEIEIFESDGSKASKIKLGHYEHMKLIKRLDSCVFTRCKAVDPKEVLGLKIERSDKYHNFKVS